MWLAYRDSEHGIDYFFNPETEETVWELPPGARADRGDEPGEDGAASWSDGSDSDESWTSGGGSSGGEDAGADEEQADEREDAGGGECEPPLPDGWEVLLDDGAPLR